MWPAKNTAFVVIHGMGAHRPFETLDSFVRNFGKLLQDENPGLKLTWHHRLLRHQDWIENYVSLTADNMPSIEFYEYYWDCYMVRQVTMAQVVKWLDEASAGAR